MTPAQLKQFLTRLTAKEVKSLAKRLSIQPGKTKDAVIEQIADGFGVEQVLRQLGIPVESTEEEALEIGRKSLNRANWRLGIAVVGFLFAIGGFLFTNYSDFSFGEVSLFQKPDAYHILLLPFGSSENCEDVNVICEREVQSRFNLMQGQDTSLNIEVKLYYDVNNRIESLSFDRAKVVGESLDADLVIWGDYQSRCKWDSTKIRLKWVTVDEEDAFLDRKKSVDYHTVSEISKIEEGEITGDVEDIVYWGLGLEAQRNYQTENALMHFEKINIKPRKEYAVVVLKQALCYSFFSVRNDTICRYMRSNSQRASGKFLRNFLRPENKGIYWLFNKGIFKAKFSGNTFFKGRNEEIIELTTKAIMLDPDYASAYFFRGSALYKDNYCYWAEEDFTKAIELSPTFVSAYNDRALLYQKMNRHEEAAADFAKVRELDSLRRAQHTIPVFK